MFVWEILQLHEKTVISHKVNMQLPCELTIPFQDIDQRLMKTHVHKTGLKCWQEHYLYQATTGENQKFTRRQIININKWFLILYHGNKELKSTNTCNNTYECRLYCPSLEARSGTELMVWPHLYGLQSRQTKPQQKAEQRVPQCLCGGGEQGMVSRKEVWLTGSKDKGNCFVWNFFHFVSGGVSRFANSPRLVHCVHPGSAYFCM